MTRDLKIAKEARNLIARKGGWVRGDMKEEKVNGTFAYCALGAIREAAKPARGKRVATKLADIIDPESWLSTSTITYFNDHIAKDKRYVLRKFDKLITQLKSNGK